MCMVLDDLPLFDVTVGTGLSMAEQQISVSCVAGTKLHNQV